MFVEVLGGVLRRRTGSCESTAEGSRASCMQARYHTEIGDALRAVWRRRLCICELEVNRSVRLHLWRLHCVMTYSVYDIESLVLESVGGGLANQCHVLGHVGVIVVGMSIPGFRYYVGDGMDDERRSQIHHVCCGTAS